MVEEERQLRTIEEEDEKETIKDMIGDTEQ
jgi:hypothetical protein